MSHVLSSITREKKNQWVITLWMIDILLVMNVLKNSWWTCVSIVVCRLPMDVGPCRERYDRWYYDAERSSCQPFVYGGCAGNMNRFKSFESCTTFCSPSSADQARPAAPAPSYPSPSTTNGFSFILFFKKKKSFFCFN